MKTTLLFIRHGQSMANVSGVFAGQLDVSLSELGRKQAEELKEYLLSKYKIDAIYSSDLSRAYETALPIAMALGLSIQKDSALREIDGGKWEGMYIPDIAKSYPEDFQTWESDIGLARCTGGESFKEVQTRGLQTVLRIARENDGKCVVIATHAAMIRALTCAFRGLPLTEMQHIPFVPNASLSEVRFQRGAFEIVSYADISFFFFFVTELPKSI